ncbi:hypothetical protein P170DRAFT_448111 [Aspergillus steynii IBT 23096]|uniref:Uncharacterized protein n=1 Tax=Aspergillus steynii IBT 23096 TaxID=1392250 RepID=A0A2I2G6A2_9EURO|nr:uncharacterized protein P170DRAFT_448111 [Aspergillus steynii IBT 23096]PLB48407.1 hypothetical protein P170DRAFT_448111 [Aspergillus steynii IBT 23096]
MPGQEEFRLFGDLWLPDPEQALSSQELVHVRAILPQIRAFETNWMNHTKYSYTRSGWSLNEAYEEFRDRECNWWEARGVTRPRQYMVCPSGELNASVACHLFNPTFSVDDPCCGETEDLSNPSISQLNNAEFSTQNNCLIFDHLARRDASKHCATTYPDDLLDLHEQFVFALRDAMNAKIEICWGANVRERMFKKIHLQPFRLWGEFAGVVLYMEITQNRLKRFVIFVAHPQRFLYVKSNREKARAWRHRFGISQDQALTVAARLGGIQIPPNFYVLDPRLARNLCVPRTVSDQRSIWRGQAVAQLKKAFPAVDLSASTDRPHHIRPTKEDKSSVQSVFTLLAKVKPGKINESVNLPQIVDDTALRNLRLQKIANYWNDLGELLDAFISNPNVGTYSGSAPREEGLPDPFIEFIQAQDGLKFNKREISCRADLKIAFELLQKCQGTPETLDILTLAVSVLTAYGWMISRPRKPQVDNLLILRGYPNNTVARKCSGCRKEYLDDPFAYWAKSRPNCYVLCGKIKHLPCTRKDLEEKRLDQFDKWFLLRPEELGDLPPEVEVSCRNCQETRLVEARWTDIYFNNNLSINGRIAALIEAQRLIEADNIIKENGLDQD